MTDRTVTPNELSALAARLALAAGSLRAPRALRSDLALAAAVIFTLIRTGVIAGPVDLGGGDGCCDRHRTATLPPQRPGSHRGLTRPPRPPQAQGHRHRDAPGSNWGNSPVRKTKRYQTDRHGRASHWPRR